MCRNFGERDSPEDDKSEGARDDKLSLVFFQNEF